MFVSWLSVALLKAKKNCFGREVNNVYFADRDYSITELCMSTANPMKDGWLSRTPFFLCLHYSGRSSEAKTGAHRFAL
jgi:hypothetical protein